MRRRASIRGMCGSAAAPQSGCALPRPKPCAVVRSRQMAPLQCRVPRQQVYQPCPRRQAHVYNRSMPTFNVLPLEDRRPTPGAAHTNCRPHTPPAARLPAARVLLCSRGIRVVHSGTCCERCREAGWRSPALLKRREVRRRRPREHNASRPLFAVLTEAATVPANQVRRRWPCLQRTPTGVQRRRMNCRRIWWNCAALLSYAGSGQKEKPGKVVRQERIDMQKRGGARQMAYQRVADGVAAKRMEAVAPVEAIQCAGR